MDEHQSRELPRFKTKKEVRVLIHQVEGINVCVIEDLHLKGMCVSFNKGLPQDQPVKMSFMIDDNAPIQIEAQLLWDKEDQGRYTYGLEFTRISDVDKDRIYKYLSDTHYDQFKAKWFS